MPTTFFDWFNYLLWAGNTAAPTLALVGAPFAAWFGWHRWRREQLSVRRAAVASDIAVAVRKFIGGVLHASAGIPRSTSSEHEPEPKIAETPKEIATKQGRRFARRSEARWAAVDLQAFTEAMDLAKGFLSDDVNTVLEEIWATKHEIFDAQARHLREVVNGDREIRYFPVGWGDDPTKKLLALRKRAMNALAYHIRMET